MKIISTLGIIVIVILGFSILSVVGIGLKVALFPVKVLEKEIDVGYEAVDKVMTADNAIYNYEWFKQQYEDIEASKNKLDNAIVTQEQFNKKMPENRVDWTFEDKSQEAKLDMIVLGSKNHLEQQIADYNARAKMATRNIFEDNVLPDYIEALTFIKQ